MDQSRISARDVYFSPRDIYSGFSWGRISVDNPLGHPHLIDLVKYKETGQDESKLRLVDGIVTMLFYYGVDKKHVDDFLDQENILKFDFLRKGPQGQLWILREKKHIEAIKYSPDTSVPERLNIDIRVKFEIMLTGKWEPRRVEGKCVEGAELTVNKDANVIEGWGSRLAHIIIQGRLWEEGDVAGDGSKIRVNKVNS